MSMDDKKASVNKKTFIASTFTTLEDLAKSQYLGSSHVHCQFPYFVYEQCKHPLAKELAQVGFETLFFKDHGIVNLME